VEGAEQPGWEPGWYEFPQGGGRRYWDGQAWTDHFVPPPPTESAGLSFGRIVLAVWAGAVLGWGTIWLLSKATEEVYWPVKTVLERDDVDSVDEAIEQLEFNDAPVVPEP
jgi:hypothetical protein